MIRLKYLSNIIKHLQVYERLKVYLYFDFSSFSYKRLPKSKPIRKFLHFYFYQSSCVDHKKTQSTDYDINIVRRYLKKTVKGHLEPGNVNKDH